jgi:hypothetical protein
MLQIELQLWSALANTRVAGEAAPIPVIPYPAVKRAQATQSRPSGHMSRSRVDSTRRFLNERSDPGLFGSSQVL